MQLITKYRNSIFQSFDVISDLKGKKFVFYKAIDDIFKFLDVEITQNQLECIYIELFKHVNNINMLEYRKILEIFNDKYIFTDEIPFMAGKEEYYRSGENTRKFSSSRKLETKGSMMWNSTIFDKASLLTFSSKKKTILLSLILDSFTNRKDQHLFMFLSIFLIRF